MRKLVLTVIGAVVFVGLLLTAPQVSILQSGLQLGTGWKPEAASPVTVQQVPTLRGAEGFAYCDRPLEVHGFPFATRRPDDLSVGGCGDSINNAAILLNTVTYLLFSALIVHIFAKTARYKKARHG